jgi:RES domain-containing protein
LKVPSALVPEEFNYLMNPLHSKAGKVKVIKRSPFNFDERLVS